MDGIDKPVVPVKRCYSREEITEAAWLWLRENYPPDNSADSASKWWERFGMMVDFINDHFPTSAHVMAPGSAVPSDQMVATPGDSRSPKPPLGVVPENIWHSRRCKDLARAIHEYFEAGMWPKSEWVEELARRLPHANAKALAQPGHQKDE